MPAENTPQNASDKPGNEPGRPLAQLDRQVVDALIDATARLLQQKSRMDITVREIAQAAGVNPAMINYYFQSKNGLFIVFIDHLIERLSEAMLALEKQIEVIDVERENPTRLIVTTLIHARSDNASALHLLASEIQLNSELKHAYSTRHAARATKTLKRILQRLMDHGIYRSDLDLNFTAFTIQTLLSQHVINESVLSDAFDLNPGPDMIANWIDYLTETFDRSFRPLPPTSMPVRSDNK